MTLPDDLHRRLRTEFVGDAYDLPLDRGALLSAVEERLERGRFRRRAAAAVLTAVVAVFAVIGVVYFRRIGERRNPVQSIALDVKEVRDEL